MLNDSENNNIKNNDNIDDKIDKNQSYFNLEKSVKSPEILKKILSHLEYRNKLRLVSYSKQIQKKLKLNINDYKNESKREIIGERNGKGKEYKLGSNILIFEGEYKDGKRNGKGKELYYEGKLKFEGEYLNGKRNGKGKEYNDNRNLIFEGEYLNGKRNGRGKEYMMMEKFSLMVNIIKIKDGKGMDIVKKVRKYLKLKKVMEKEKYILMMVN